MFNKTSDTREMPTQKFSIQDKKDILTMLHSGVSKKAVARLVGIEKKELTIWELRYQQYGMQGLAPLQRRTLSADYKKQLVNEYLNGDLSMREMCAKHGVCLSSLKNWLRQYRPIAASSN